MSNKVIEVMNEQNLGLSGIIRAKNEGKFLEACIDSVINSLDELIVVYNDCTDDTEIVLNRKMEQYPDKLKIYAYNHNILSHNLSKEEFEYAASLPGDSNRLHCNQCNFGLEHTIYSHAVKIDPDQVYFEDEVRRWSRACKGDFELVSVSDNIIGGAFALYISLYRRLSALSKKALTFMVPKWLLDMVNGSYNRFLSKKLFEGKIAVSLSGVNVFYDKDWFIPFDKFNIHPPYNGEGDTLIFKKSKDTYYERYAIDAETYRVIEKFKHPYRVLVSGIPVWFHLHANRAYCASKVRKIKHDNPNLFVLPTRFVKLKYSEVLKIFGRNRSRLYQQILFALVHRMGDKTISKNLYLLNKIEVRNLS